MPGSVRLGPPVLGRGMLTRPRLVRLLRGRWEHRLTVVVGGPGLGKTTLLAQTLAENELAPYGSDVWLAVEASDTDAHRLVEDMREALGGPRGEDPVAALAASVWSHAPSPVCFVLDDVHLLERASAGHDSLVRLLQALPANGHLLVAARTDPGFALARLEAAGGVLVVGEEDLRFTDDELGELATIGGVDASRVAPSGGWPALAQLAVRAAPGRSGDFLWEEVLEPLGGDRRELLAVLCDLGGADEALASAALGRPVDLAAETEGVPLIAAGIDGWYQPHALWRSVGAVGLDADAQATVRRRAVPHLVESRRFDRAFDLLSEAGLWDLAPGLLRDACGVGVRPVMGSLDRWLRISPDDVLTSAGGRLAAGVRDEMVDVGAAEAPLVESRSLFEADGDVDGELAAIAHLARMLWQRQDLASILTLAPRLQVLARAGSTMASALAAIGRAFVFDLRSDDAAMASALATVRGGPGDLWSAVLGWLRALADVDRGDPAAGLATIAGLDPVDDPNITLTLETWFWHCRWLVGDVDAVVHASAGLVAAVEASGVAQNITLTSASFARCLLYLGRVDDAQPLLALARQTRDKARGNALVTLVLAEASQQLAEGDEEGAAATLRLGLEQHPLETGPARRRWRDSLPLTFVLLPETRDAWRALPLRGHHVVLRDLAAAVVAARGEGAVELVGLSLPDLGVVRSGLHHRFGAELSVALHGSGRPEGAALLDALGPAGRDVVRGLAGAGRRGQADAAGRLLADVPAAPVDALTIGVLGPLRVQRGAEPVAAPEFRRDRVRQLLAFLLSHRSTTRGAVIGALWPDLDESAAVNNLRVTLSLLNRALEPGRPASEPPYFVRVDDDRLRLVTAGLVVDADLFDEHLSSARDAERNATPSLALPHYRAALALYRGDLYADVDEGEWLLVERERHRIGYVNALVRAAQLVAAIGDVNEAEALACATLDTDPWSEPAAGVLVATALAGGNRSAAQQRMRRCYDIAAELGVEPSQETLRLQRQVRSTPVSTVADVVHGSL